MALRLSLTLIAGLAGLALAAWQADDAQAGHGQCEDQAISEEQAMLQLQDAVPGARTRSEAAAPASPADKGGVPGPTPARPKVFVGISSGPGYARRREAWRASQCGKRLRDAGIQYKFVIGVPTDDSSMLTEHIQGTRATPHEQEESEELLREIDSFGDVKIIPMNDVYMGLPFKTLAIYREGFYHAGAEYIMEMDDDYCVNPEALFAGIAEHTAKHGSQQLYAGAYMWKGNEDPRMIGADGKVNRYFSGVGSFLSRDLVKLIIEDDGAHSILFAPYGTTDEDAQAGRWVRYAREKHGIALEYKTVPGLLAKIGPG